MNKIGVLLSGRSKDILNIVANQLKDSPEYDLSTKVVTNGHFDPLYGLSNFPDILILFLSKNYREELSCLSNRSPSIRPTTITIYEAHDPNVIRLAMKAGARDFLSVETILSSIDTLKETLSDVISEKRSSNQDRKIISVMNSKGGSGASFIACNLAYTLSNRHPTALVDLNLQFGTQSLYLDLTSDPTKNVVEALRFAPTLDGKALSAYMTSYENSLKVLSAPNDKMVLYNEVSVENLSSLLSLLKSTYVNIVVDLPLVFDSLSIITLESSSKIIIVAQQNLPSFRDTRKLINIMKQDLEISTDRIMIAVNRYDPKSIIEIDEFEDIETITIPNDYGTVKESVNHGVPMEIHARKNKVTSSIISLADKISGTVVKPKLGFMSLFH